VQKDVALGCRTKVVEPRRHEVQVAEPHRRRHRCPRLRRLLERGQKCGGQKAAADHHGEQRRQQAPQAPGVEIEQPHATGGLDLLHQKPCDQEARQHEKHVNTDETALQPGHARMGSDHQRHGDRPQTLDIGPVTEPVTRTRRDRHGRTHGD
jgi:hypothetical protein